MSCTVLAHAITRRPQQLPASARLAAMAAARSSSSSPAPLAAGAGCGRVRSATSVPACGQ